MHEMAHLFHNWKRAPIGLKETRHKEFLLNIAFRETGNICISHAKRTAEFWSLGRAHLSGDNYLSGSAESPQISH